MLVNCPAVKHPDKIITAPCQQSVSLQGVECKTLDLLIVALNLAGHCLVC